MTQTEPHFVVAVPTSRLWLHRVPFIVGAAVGLIAIARLLTNPEGAPSDPVLFLTVFSLAVVACIVVMARFNRFGISGDGLAPPEKPLSAVLHEGWIVPWSAVNDVKVSVSGSRSRRGRQRLRTRTSSAVSPSDWYLTSGAAYRWFGDPLRADLFFDLLSRVESAIKKKGGPLTSEEARLCLGLG